MTARPLVGPASAYPTFRRPALICFSGPKDVFVPGFIVGWSAGFDILICASSQAVILSCVVIRVMAAVPKKRRRSRVMLTGSYSFLTSDRARCLNGRISPINGFSSAHARFIFSYEKLPHRTKTMIQPQPLKNLLGEGSDLAKSPLTAACNKVGKKARTDGI